MNKFNAGDKIINKFGVVWLVTGGSDVIIYGVVLHHPNVTLIGKSSVSYDTYVDSWKVLDEPMTMFNPPTLKVGDLVEYRTDDESRECIIQAERLDDEFSIVDLRTGEYLVVPGVHLIKINSVTV